MQTAARMVIYMNITELKGIGEKTADLLNRLSVYTVEDLVGFYPRDYDVYEKPVFINDYIQEPERNITAIDGVVVKSVEMYNTGRLRVISTYIKDCEGGTCKCVWFNMPFLRNTLKIGARYVFRGHASIKKNQMVLEQPQLYTLAQYGKLMGEMQPVYPLTKGLSNKVVAKAVRQALEKYKTGLEKEYIPSEIREKYHLAEHNFALVQIHFPKSMEEYMEARKRLAFEEFFLFVLAVRSLKEKNVCQKNEYVIPDDKRTGEFILKLPYKLTDAQLRTWCEVKEDMSSKHMMSRLIQGDVGSGKTIIAVLALMNAAFSGNQGAMMVPTEVLAKQQHEAMTNMFAQFGVELKVELLVGSMTAVQKREACKRIADGQADIIVGTHALIQEKVEYKKLALVITDEQHRFGVNQRRTISEKGHNPHILVMSATPIPRTLAIIVYGDLDISIIDEMPSDRLPIKNCVVDESYRAKAYRFMENQIKEGRQVYVICPMVEESENIEAENVIDYTESMKKSMPDSIRIEYLHGKMKPSEKNRIMELFSAGSIDILVSTTVVEVGVNVPNATVMMVENAERFGLAQLHQLRGRVGRGGYQSYCIFSTASKSKKIKERLEILNKSNDGFKIAEEDLKLRGPGDFFGVRQSGEFDFGIGDIFADARVLKAAAASADIIMSDAQWSDRQENAVLKSKVDEYTLRCLNKLNI
ncbi:MAG: ATP-dependent DNA helicase RecG [Eubacteriales bacterium]|nr:ATP-dependent DNA helicase RecG [Eubacteriales bacterium]